MFLLFAVLTILIVLCAGGALLNYLKQRSDRVQPTTTSAPVAAPADGTSTPEQITKGDA